MRAIAAINLACAVLLLGACDKSSSLTPGIDTPRPMVSIARLKAEINTSSTPLRQDIVIRGAVISTDRYGEFDRELILEDDTGGIAIAADHPMLATDYPIGCLLTVYCNGLTLTSYGGKTVLGVAPDSDYGSGRIPRNDLVRYLRKEPAGAAPPQAVTTTFSEISARHIDTYVRFDNVRFREQGTWCDMDRLTWQPITTDRTLVDPSGATFVVRTLGGCMYATEPVPFGTGSVWGIIDYFGGRYSLRIVSAQTNFSIAATPATTYLSTAEY